MQVLGKFFFSVGFALFFYYFVVFIFQFVTDLDTKSAAFWPWCAPNLHIENIFIETILSKENWIY